MKIWNYQEKRLSIELSISHTISFQAQSVLHKYDFHQKSDIVVL